MWSFFTVAEPAPNNTKTFQKCIIVKNGLATWYSLVFKTTYERIFLNFLTDMEVTESYTMVNKTH